LTDDANEARRMVSDMSLLLAKGSTFSAPNVKAGETFLMIEASGALPLVRLLPAQPNLVMTSFRHLNRELITRLQPDRVVFPLFWPPTDAVETLERLRSFGFHGIACVLSGPLPCPSEVQKELRTAASGIEVHLLCLAKWPGRNAPPGPQADPE
jgi:hypothetical protein